ncbi:uncharacterized protein LOC118437298 isoform X2 [Folsomia candida]|uniref:Protein FAM65B n=1 Tax=Folsomia candida TaxID=158441 RepID=A0A226DP98_FOLCA|nr:uncharacterized protein LOC118437298 isoform X2 [Folsomia candida]OXA47352.1 Protein FAM65B [Folsomia candida]
MAFASIGGHVVASKTMGRKNCVGSSSQVDRKYMNLRIDLPYGRGQNEFCGKLKITQKLGWNVQKIEDTEEWKYYALVVELQALVKTTNARGERCHTLLREITPEANSKFICNSKIFAVVSGEENGIRKGFNLTQLRPSILLRNPVSFPFKIQLPQNPLPATLTSRAISIDYFLVAYRRTDNGYEPLLNENCQNIEAIT